MEAEAPGPAPNWAESMESVPAPGGGDVDQIEEANTQQEMVLRDDHREAQTKNELPMLRQQSCPVVEGPVATTVPEGEVELPTLVGDEETRRQRTVFARGPEEQASSETHRREREVERDSGGHFPGAFAEGEWENELARQILVLYGTAMESEDTIRGAETDFAIDPDAEPRSKVDLVEARKEYARAALARAGRADQTEDKATKKRTKRKTKAKRSQAVAEVSPVPPRRAFGAAPVMPSQTRPIWFLGSGALHAEWSALPEESGFLLRLSTLEEAGKYAKYVDAVEASLNEYAQCAEREPGPLFSRLWRQLVVTANVFGLRCIDQKRHADALDLLKKAQLLAGAPDFLERREISELKAFVDDSHAYYYYRRNKARAALEFAARAMRVHVKLQQWPHVAKCNVHSACILSKLGRHPEAARCLGQVLHLVRSGRLDIGGGGAAPHKLCMIAVAYHNLAVEQLLLNHVAEAAVSAQNARRLARLCLSYSNRWLHNFEHTHKAAVEQLARHSTCLENVQRSHHAKLQSSSSGGGGGRGGPPGSSSCNNATGGRSLLTTTASKKRNSSAGHHHSRSSPGQQRPASAARASST